MRAFSTTTGSAPSAWAARNQVILDGQRLDPYVSSGIRSRTGAAAWPASQVSSETPATAQPDGPGRSGRLCSATWTNEPFGVEPG